MEGIRDKRAYKYEICGSLLAARCQHGDPQPIKRA